MQEENYAAFPPVVLKDMVNSFLRCYLARDSDQFNSDQRPMDSSG
jgi:hypothetical protein